MDHKPNERIEVERTGVREHAPGETAEYREREVIREKPMPDDRAARERSIGSLVKELRDETSTLIRQELALARTEMSEKARIFGRNAASIGTGAAVLFAGLLVLLFAGSAGLYAAFVYFGMANYVAGWLAPLIVGAVVAIIGYAMMQKGISTIRQQSPVPEKTVDTLKEDKQWLKNKTTE